MKKIVVFISLGFILGGCNKDDFSWDLPRNNQLDGQIDSGDGIQVPNKNAPKINTGSVSNITASASKVSGEITDIGSSEIYSYGHCWSLSPLPTIANDKTNLGSSNSSGIYTSSLSGLSANTTYYIRAYASNIYGTSYGNQVTLKTAPLLNAPKINTGSVSNITASASKVSGEITDIGSSEIYSYGHCWSLSPLPTIANDKTNLGSSNSSGIYTSSLSGLSANTTYYIRAYASNIYGTSYGNQVTLKTAPLLYEYINCESLSEFTVYVDKISPSSGSSWIIGSGYIGSGFKTTGSNYGGYIEFSRNFTKNVKLRFWALNIDLGYPSGSPPDVLIDGIKVGTSKITSSPAYYSYWMQLETEGVILSGDHTIRIDYTGRNRYQDYYIDEIEFWSQ